jgi:predicted dehydrogenase
LKILIAGLGSIGRQHLRNLLTLGEKDILFYRTHQSTLPEDVLADFPVETDLVQALNHKPDAVIISNPTSMHLEVAIPAARAGCHLLLEKPISDSLEGIDELFKAVKSGGGKVLVGYQFRFHPGLQKVDDLLRNGALGKLISARAHWGEYLPGWHPWEDYRQGYSARAELGGGVVLTLSHPLDYLFWLLGDILEVWAFSGNLGELGVDVEDSAEIGLKFSSGVIGSVHLDYLQQPPNHYLELIGVDGTITWNYANGEVRMFQSGENAWQSFAIRDDFERNDMLLAEMSHFIELVRGKEESRCSLEDGAHAMNLVLAAKRSSAEKKIVRLNEYIGVNG